MKIYIVGGAVRDRLLDLPVQDRDYLVVGATPDDMIARGFRPVGKDFPVFLHPSTQEEYALARTERKTAPGYQGFIFHASPDVSLEQDLARRDLTINAIAQAEDGTLVDPFGGQTDLQSKVFRHVSSAFAEDPVRILRVARFAARFTDFVVAPETNALMRQMVEAGEVDALVPERVWQEIARGLMESTPSRMFAVLRDCGALSRIVPELDDALCGVPPSTQRQSEMDSGVHAMMAIDVAAEKKYALPIRFAALTHDLGKETGWPRPQEHAVQSVRLADAVCQRLKVPKECRDLALMTAREQGNVGRALELDAAALVTLLERCDAFRKPQRFVDMLHASECDYRRRADFADQPFPQAAHLGAALKAAQTVNAGEIARHYLDQPQRIAEAVRTARIAAVGRSIAAGAAATRDA